MEDLVKLLREAAAGAVSQASLERGAKWIEAMKREFPFVHSVLIKLLYQQPEDVLDTLAKFNRGFEEYRRNAHALEYIRQLQLRLRGQKT